MSVAVGDTIGICLPLPRVSPLVLEPSSQWDEDTRVQLGTFLGTYARSQTQEVMVFFLRMTARSNQTLATLLVSQRRDRVDTSRSACRDSDRQHRDTAEQHRHRRDRCQVRSAHTKQKLRQ